MLGKKRKAERARKEEEAWKKQVDKQVEINKIQSGINSFTDAQKAYQAALQNQLNQPVNQYGTSSGSFMNAPTSTATTSNKPASLFYYGQTFVPENTPQDSFVPKVWAVVKVTSDSNYNVAVFSSEQLADVYIKKLDMYNDKTEDCYYEVEEFIIDSNIEEAKDVLPLQPEQ